MLSIRISEVVQRIIHKELLHKGRKEEAIYINFDLRMDHHCNGREYWQSRGLHLLYHTLPGMVYVNVFSGITDNPFASIKEVKGWKHECSHDSCWRDITVFSKVYFEMAEAINASLAVDGLKPIAPKDMHEWSSFGRELYRWVPVRVTKDQNDPSSYDKLVELV